MGLLSFLFPSLKPAVPPVEPHEADWLDDCFRWTVETLGLNSLKSDAFNFEEAPQGPITREWLEKLLSKLQRHVGLHQSDFLLELDEQGSPNQVGVIKMRSPDRYYYRLKIRNPQKTFLNDLVLNMALALCRILLAEKAEILEDDYEGSLLTYIALCYLGLGHLSFTQQSEGILHLNGHEITTETQAYILGYAHWLANGSLPSSTEAKMPQKLKKGFQQSLRFFRKKRPHKRFLSQHKELDDCRQMINNGWTFYRNGQIPQAIKQIRQVIERSEQTAFLRNTLGYFKLRAKHFLNSVHDFETAQKLDPNWADPLNNLGFAEMMLHNLKSGHKLIQDSLDMDPENSYGYRNLGVYHAIRHNFREAADNFEKALFMDGKTELTHYFYGLAYLAKQDWKEALFHLRKSANMGEMEAAIKLRKLGFSDDTPHRKAG